MSLEDLITKATSETNTSENWGAVIQICEKADKTEATAREAVQVLCRRLQHKNVNVVLFTLTVANSLVQNCSVKVRREISSRNFVDTIVKLVSTRTTHETIRTRILDLLQQWAELFKPDSTLGFIVDTYNQLKAEGITFPSPNAQKEPRKQSDIDKAKEEEELQIALALSLSAQESKPKKTAAFSTVNRSSVDAAPKKPAALFQVRALYDFAGNEDGEFPLVRGEIVNVYDSTTFKDWWKGESIQTGRVGIFPANYVEKSSDGPVGGTPIGAVGTSGTLDDYLQAESDKVQEFIMLLTRVDPMKDNLSENEKLQELYQSLIMTRGRLMKLIEGFKTKQDNLVTLSDRFTRAAASYHKLSEASLAQFRGGYQYGANVPVPPAPVAAPYFAPRKPSHPPAGMPTHDPYQQQGILPQLPPQQLQYMQHQPQMPPPQAGHVYGGYAQ
ncbi:hypothetical protein BJ742DRAFT_804827 [Cladochytrium replicatum]|nr:hypothetical protein BJ742DRAFT_804827 [Cladochytrium replicatum]